ncbi:DUF4160 domain-containing protein [Rikenella microfusus]|uniref:DUF4160 domain-containing protein n=1 Tax=Rikenella microfusus TaxID=28139 RepID=A0A379MS80_9BACT|nr:DUF4160 domain-containing protein [Rikenella microfusus]SUE34286.1 Uncharacterised protein [Rikenella microfusus]
MPEICRFFGIVIVMFADDHNPPHFHVKYGNHRALVGINSEVIRGQLPLRVVKLVSQWLDLHRDELMENWERLQRGEELMGIEPLK